jgi:hypothetical protein
MIKKIYYDHQFRVWVGLILDWNEFQIGDCEYFATKKLAEDWMLE